MVAKFHWLLIKQTHERRNCKVDISFVLQPQLRERINYQLRIPTITCIHLFVNKFSHWWSWNVSYHICTVVTGAAALTSKETEPQSLNQGHRSRPDSSPVSPFLKVCLTSSPFPSPSLIRHVLESLFCSPRHSTTPSHLLVSVGWTPNNVLEPNNLIL